MTHDREGMMPRARVFNIIPFSDSGESFQNSEPSLAIDPLDPTQIFAGAFGDLDVSPHPFFKSITGGTAWFDDGSLFHADKSMAWKTDGSGAIATTLLDDVINTYFQATGGTSFGAPINTFDPVHVLDQPWVRTGPSNHVYVGYNDLSFFPGNTARILVSTNGGVSYTDVALDRLGGRIIQDSPSIREAVNGNTVYAVFERWIRQIENDANGQRFTSQVVVVRSDDGGADGFTALGAGGNGVVAGTPIAVFANTSNTPLTLGQERTGSDLAIAVDPNNAAHVVVVWANAPGANGAGILQLQLAESFDSGANWSIKFETPAATRSDQPAVSISSTGAIGLLYNNYDPATDLLSQHIVTTTDDFVTFTDQTLATESNATPISQFHPYVGDFFDLTSVGNTFYGVFSASNADNGTDAQFSNVVFGRNFTGNSGTSSFQLVDTNGNPVASSIDTYFFTYQLGDSFGKIFLHSDAGQNAYWLMDQSVRQGSGTDLPFTGPTWHVRALVDYDNSGPDFSDLVWQNDNGAVAIWQLQGTTPIHQNDLGQNPGPTWHIEAAKDFDGNTVADVLFQNDNGQVALWELQNTGAGPQILNQFDIGQNPGATWHAAAAGDFNGDSRAGILFLNDDGVSAAIWEMNPDGPAIGPNGIFTQQVNLKSTGSPTWHPIAAADFNADGKDDILWQNTNGAVAIWEMSGNNNTTAIKPNGEFNIAGTEFVGPTWHVVAARDFDNDSKADLLWQNDNGAIALWENFTEGPIGSVQASFTTQLDITPQPNPSGHLDWHIV
jgi:FG-GAP-like repeat